MTDPRQRAKYGFGASQNLTNASADRPEADFYLRPVWRRVWLARELANQRGIEPANRRLRTKPLIYKRFLSPYKITPGKPSGDYGPPETQNRHSLPNASQTPKRQTLLKPRDFLAPEKPERRSRQ